MDVIIYNKIKSEANRIIDAVGVSYLNYATKLATMFEESRYVPQKLTFSPVMLSSSELGVNNFLYHGYINNETPYGVIEVEMHLGQITPFSLRSMFNQAYGTRSVKATGNFQYCTSYCYMFDYPYYFRNIDIEFDFTSCTADNSGIIAPSGSNDYVTSLRFVPNTASVSINIKAFKMLDDTTLISAANCLVSDISGKTLTLHATPKEKCSTIMGTNNSGIFVADTQGTLSLADFITNVKGWTLA